MEINIKEILLYPYRLKCKLGINLLPGEHTPDTIEKWTKGVIKSEWFDEPKEEKKEK